MNSSSAIKLFVGLFAVMTIVEQTNACHNLFLCNYYGCWRVWQYTHWGGHWICYYGNGHYGHLTAPCVDFNPANATDTATGVTGTGDGSSDNFQVGDSILVETPKNYTGEDWKPASIEFPTTSSNKIGCVTLHAQANCGGQNISVDSKSDTTKDLSAVNFSDGIKSMSPC